MPYHLDFEWLKLDFLKKRLDREDLIPSQLLLREELDDKLSRFDKAGIRTLARLESSLASPKLVQKTAAATGIPAHYLVIIGRTLRSYRPKPAVIAKYPGADKKTVAALARLGIKDSRSLFEAACSKKERKALAGKAGIDENRLLELVRLSDISRIQWVSPLFARLLFDAGFDSVKTISQSTPDAIFRKVDAQNKLLKLYRGKIGLRDMGRLVFLVSLLPCELEE